MSQRTRIAAGNWKMNTSLAEGVALAEALAEEWLNAPGKEMILAPPFTHLSSVRAKLKTSAIQLAAQNCHWETQGAYTGEVSLSMLVDVGVDAVIVGHSERRELFGETNAIVKQKVDAVLAAGLRVILCCGESLTTREAGAANDFVEKQLKESLLHLSDVEMGSVIIAYEPIWAIGTGLTATTEQAQEMHACIRSLVATAYSDAIADKLTILYGGSVKPGNAKELFSQKDVDGGLVGGASLSTTDFLAIAAAL
jgi:triosephosphate isomerase